MRDRGKVRNKCISHGKEFKELKIVERKKGNKRK